MGQEEEREELATGDLPLEELATGELPLEKRATGEPGLVWVVVEGAIEEAVGLGLMEEGASTKEGTTTGRTADVLLLWC